MKNNLSNVFIEQENSYVRHFVIGLLLVLTTLLIYFTGGTKNVYVHFMYIPIVVAAIDRSKVKVLLVAILAGFLVGPFMPVDVIQGQMQPLQSWLLRMGMFVFVGEIVYYLHRRASNELYATKLVLKSISEGVCVINDNDVIIFANEVFCSAHNLIKEQIVGENIYEFLYNHYSKDLNYDDYRTLVKALKENTTVKNMLLPKFVNSYGEETTEYNISTIKAHGINNSIIVIKNIEEKLNYNRYLQKLSYNDSLTGLPNRRAFKNHIESLHDESILPFGVLFIDINGIKFINDSFGHQKGDELIMMVSYITNTAVSKKGYVARLDGDEFIGLINNATSEVMDKIVNRINDEVSKIQINSISMNVSCGYSIVDDLNNIDEAIKVSENNMYIDKNSSSYSGRNNPIDTIINTLHEKDEYSEEHSKSVSRISGNLARALKLPGNQIKEIEQAALLHDIGKIIVPINILTKQGRLTEKEYSKMKEHSEIGYRLLSTMKSLNEIPKMVLYHHERWDGTGYPHQIKKQDIPLGARIISIADSFNAMTTNRPYRSKLTDEVALQEMIHCKETQFDPLLIDVFEKHFEEIIR